MKRKVLIVIIAILSAILVAGLAILFISSNADKTPSAQAPQESVSGQPQTPEQIPTDADSETVVAPEDAQPGSDMPAAPGETVNGEAGNEGENTAPNTTVPSTVPGTSTTTPTTPSTTPGTTTPTNPTTPGTTTPATQPTDPGTTTPTVNLGTSDPTEGTIVPNLPTEPDTTIPNTSELDYITYHNMSGEQQAAFINSFDSIEAFFNWYNAAQKEYEDSLTEIDGSTPIDLGDLSGGN